MSDNKTSFWGMIKIIFFSLVAIRSLMIIILAVGKKCDPPPLPPNPKTEITINRDSIIRLNNYLGFQVHKNNIAYIFKNTCTEKNATSYNFHSIEILDTISPDNSVNIKFMNVDNSEISASLIQHVLDNNQKFSVSNFPGDIAKYLSYQFRRKSKDGLDAVQEKGGEKLNNGPYNPSNLYLFKDYSEITRFPIKVSTKLFVNQTDKTLPISLIKIFEYNNLHSWLLVPLSDTSKAYIEYANSYLDKNLTFDFGESSKTFSCKPDGKK